MSIEQVCDEIVTPAILDSLNMYEGQVNQQLYEMAKTHEGNNDGFIPLEPNTSTYPFQGISCIAVRGSNVTSEIASEWGSTLYSEYRQVVDSFKEREDLLDEIGEEVKNHNNISVVTDHLDVNALAVASNGLMLALYERKIITPAEVETVLFANAMIKFTSLDTPDGIIPTPEILKRLYRTTLYTHPDSPSRIEGIMDEVRNPINISVIRYLMKLKIMEKSVISFIAGSGGRDVPVINTDGSRTIHQGPIADATTKTMRKDFLLDVGLDTTEDNPILYIGNLQAPSRDPNRGHKALTSIAENMSDLSKTPREYHKDSEKFAEAILDKAA